MSPRCTGEPISWLRLERYHLGELGPEERSRIDQHLATCPACKACLERIEGDDAVALPPLPAPMPVRRVVRMRRPVLIGAVVATLAAAAAVVLAMRGSQPTDGERVAFQGARVKGDGIAFSLVRDDGMRVDGAEGIYRDGDRFKAIVTCAPGAAGAFDVVVYDSSGASFPLDPSVGLACGNDVPLPGAFRLTGTGDETVCLVWNAGGSVDRTTLSSAAGLDAASGQGGVVLCKRLSVARDP
jgi:hypothetical protein